MSSAATSPVVTAPSLSRYNVARMLIASCSVITGRGFVSIATHSRAHAPASLSCVMVLAWALCAFAPPSLTPSCTFATPASLGAPAAVLGPPRDAGITWCARCGAWATRKPRRLLPRWRPPKRTLDKGGAAPLVPLRGVRSRHHLPRRGT